MSNYEERKAQRTAEHRRNHGRKLVTCGACAGTGVYDHNGSPPCSSCDGTGKMREPAPYPVAPPMPWRDALKLKQDLAAARLRARRGETA